MDTRARGLVPLFLCWCVAASAHAQPRPATRLRVDSMAGLKVEGGKAQAVTYRGRKALRIVQNDSAFSPAFQAKDYPMALFVGSDFHDGTIETELAGKPAAGADTSARGFVGLVFRSAGDGSRFECFYLRPTNGRANDQLRRNHSTQYIAHPGYPWQKLRTETPGKYESYADLESGAWTKVKIEVSGSRAKLYVNGAAQPALIVNDLKNGDSRGMIGLWVGSGTEAYFTDVVVR